MAVIKRGILGGFSGKVADIVGSSWKGIAVMKSRPLSVANPKTPGQLAQRAAFTACVRMASECLTALVKPLWDRFAQRESGFNAWISTNIGAFNDIGVPTSDSLYISKGSLTGGENFAIVANATTNAVTFTWDNNSGDGNALATDEAYILAYNETQDLWFPKATGAPRSAGTYILTDVGNIVALDVVSGYLAFRRTDGSLVSDSVWTQDSAS